MYALLLWFHSLFRWLVLASICISVVISIRGLFTNRQFSASDNLVRHSTATIAHIQLMIGMILYTQSPSVKYFFSDAYKVSYAADSFFFGSIHIILMLCSIVAITIGSAIAKRMEKDRDKFKTMLLWYSLAFIAILIAIPWPFSPFAQRPLLRLF